MAKNGNGESDDDPISKQLDAIIRLIMEEQLAAGKLKKKNQILILDSVGLTSAEIGRIVSQSSKDVASWLKKLKKGGDRIE